MRELTLTTHVALFPLFETMDFFINALSRWIFLILYQEYQISRERIIEIGVRFRPYNAPHIEISPLISRANLLTAFYMKRTLVVKGLRHFEVCLKKNYIINVFTWNSFLANVSMFPLWRIKAFFWICFVTWKATGD